jgi:hypothetical protein
LAETGTITRFDAANELALEMLEEILCPLLIALSNLAIGECQASPSPLRCFALFFLIQRTSGVINEDTAKMVMMKVMAKARGRWVGDDPRIVRSLAPCGVY